MTLQTFYKHYFPKDPYSEVRKLGVRSDTYTPKSWGSDSNVLTRLIDEIRPKTIVEIGTWKGTSAINMTRQALKHQKNVSVLCIDTWLASNIALWKENKYREYVDSVMTQNIKRTQYTQFLSNVLHAGLEKQILPFRSTASVALELLLESNVKADFIYIDAGHMKDEVATDLARAWQIIGRGGVVVGDDYNDHFPGVGQATRGFAKAKNIKLHVEGKKWWLYR